MSSSNNILYWIQDWFSNQCNEEWEHSHGIKIDTLDNPGWAVVIDLKGTYLENQKMTTVSIDHDDDNWISCSVENNQFKGFSGPKQLNEILEVFRGWAAKGQ